MNDILANVYTSAFCDEVDKIAAGQSATKRPDLLNRIRGATSKIEKRLAPAPSDTTRAPIKSWPKRVIKTSLN